MVAPSPLPKLRGGRDPVRRPWPECKMSPGLRCAVRGTVVALGQIRHRHRIRLSLCGTTVGESRYPVHCPLLLTAVLARKKGRQERKSFPGVNRRECANGGRSDRAAEGSSSCEGSHLTDSCRRWVAPGVPQRLDHPECVPVTADLPQTCESCWVTTGKPRSRLRTRPKHLNPGSADAR